MSSSHSHKDQEQDSNITTPQAEELSAEYLEQEIEAPETPSAPFHLIIEQSVLTGILNHAYSDPKNEILGDLGGHFDDIHNIVHATYFIPSRRIVTELAPASVEGETTEQHQAFVRFSERGLCYVGWYHSHPYINPLPSDKDIRMQTEMQNQVPYAVGIICSPYMKSMSPLFNVETSYFNAFRVQSFGNKSEVVKVTYSINYNEVVPPHLIHESLNINKVLIDEAQATYNLMREKCIQKQMATHFLDNEFDCFLTRFLKDNLFSSALGVRQDIRLLVQYKRRLLQKILNKLQILKEMNYFEPNEENESFSSLFTKFLQKSHETEAEPINLNSVNLLFTFNVPKERKQAQERTSHSLSGSIQQQKIQIPQELKEDKTTQQSKAGSHSQQQEILVSDSDEE